MPGAIYLAVDRGSRTATVGAYHGIGTIRRLNLDERTMRSFYEYSRPWKVSLPHLHASSAETWGHVISFIVYQTMMQPF